MDSAHHMGGACADLAVQDHFDYTRGPRSPGLRLGLGGKPTTPDEAVLPPTPDEGRLQRPGGGVKRTKSLMQKLKSMVRQKSEEPKHERSVSMSAVDARRPMPPVSPGWLDAPVLEEAEEEVMVPGASAETAPAAARNGHRATGSLDAAMMGGPSVGFPLGAEPPPLPPKKP